MNTPTEDDIRRIVREEIARAFRFTSEEAEDYDGYEEPEIDVRARSVMARVLNGVLRRLPHADDCNQYLSGADFVIKNNPQTREDYLQMNRCSCGVDDEEEADEEAYEPAYCENGPDSRSACGLQAEYEVWISLPDGTTGTTLRKCAACADRLTLRFDSDPERTVNRTPITKDEQ